MHVGLLVTLITFLGAIFLMLALLTEGGFMVLCSAVGLGQKSSVKHLCLEIISTGGLFLLVCSFESFVVDL